MIHIHVKNCGSLYCKMGVELLNKGSTHMQCGLAYVQLQQILVISQLAEVIRGVNGTTVAQFAGPQRTVDAAAGASKNTR